MLRVRKQITKPFLLLFVVKDAYDYQGRSFLHIPQDVGVNLKSDSPPDKCFLPKKQIHTWAGHSKGVSAIRWFPRSAHLLLSCSMDCKIKVRKMRKVYHLLSFTNKRPKLAYIAYLTAINKQYLLLFKKAELLFNKITLEWNRKTSINMLLGQWWVAVDGFAWKKKKNIWYRMYISYFL